MDYPTAKVRLAEGCASLTVRCIYSWDRGFMAALDSNGSGPKDSIRNQIFALFEANPEIERIVLCRATDRTTGSTVRVSKSWWQHDRPR